MPKDVNFNELGLEEDNTSKKDSSEPNPDNTGDETPDSGQSELEAFFTQLDREVNGAIFDEEVEGSNEPKPKKEDKKVDKSSKGSEDLETLKKRYKDSSDEAKRLHQELQELEPYKNFIPLLDAMRRDPNLVEHVKGYLTGNTAPTSIKDQLDLPEDFMFDFDEAMNDPRSDSARLFGHYVDAAVQHRLGQAREADMERETVERSKRVFQDAVKIDDDEMRELEGWAKQHSLQWEDIYYLKNREKREQEIARRALEEREKQLSKMQHMPRTMAGTGDSSPDIDQDRMVFDAIKKATGSVDLFK